MAETIRAVCNLSFDGYQRGELVDVDPTLCARYLKNGWLSEVDDDGLRVIPLRVTDAQLEELRALTDAYKARSDDAPMVLPPEPTVEELDAPG